jgi:hypothetical protein
LEVASQDRIFYIYIFINFFIANNLYGLAQSQRLPTKDYKWLTPEEIFIFDIHSQEDDQEEGYILEVDLDYGEEKHEDHNSFPLAPERMQITDEMLSPYAKSKLFLKR